MRKIILLIAFSFISYFVFAQKTLDKSFEGVKSLSINLASGDCTLKKGQSSTIEVHLQYTYSDDKFTPEFEQNGSKLTIKEKFKGSTSSGYSRWTITIPDGLSVKLNSGSGDLIASNLELELKTNTGSGDIDISSSKGDISINTGSGEVDIENQSGNISINSGSGDVTYEGEGKVSINVGSGDITLNNSKADFSINTGSGDIRARNIILSGSSSFNTGSGNATVELGASLDYSISINSGSGSSTLDFNNNEISGLITMKANKDRGDIEAPFSFDKTEEEGSGRDTVIIKTAKIGNKDIDIKVATGSGTAEIVK